MAKGFITFAVKKDIVVQNDKSVPVRLVQPFDIKARNVIRAWSFLNGLLFNNCIQFCQFPCAWWLDPG